MSDFSPALELDLYCSHCKKVLPAVLDRSVAESGRILNETSSYEFVCSKCSRTTCFYGKDIVAKPLEEVSSVPTAATIKPYTISQFFRIGEYISHPSHKTEGLVVGKIKGKPTQIMVKFEKKVVNLVEGIGC